MRSSEVSREWAAKRRRQQCRRMRASQPVRPSERQWSSTRSNLEGCGRRTFERLHHFLPFGDAIVVRLVECKHVHARACLHSRPHLRAFVCTDTSPSARSWCRLCAVSTRIRILRGISRAPEGCSSASCRAACSRQSTRYLRRCAACPPTAHRTHSQG